MRTFDSCRPARVGEEDVPAYYVQYNPNGAYQVRLCWGGEWHTVLVDDVFPVTKHGILAYSKAGRRQLWVPLVEKAAAKLWGSYELMAAGTLSEALSLFTGFPTEQLLLSKLPQNRAFNEVSEEQAARSGLADAADPELMWTKLLSFHQAGFLMGVACCNIKARDHGLQAPHAYGIQDVRTMGDYKLVKLRNPWGQTSWKGDWSRSSPLWTYELRQELKVAHDDEGCMWMCWDDVARYFASIEVTRVRPEFLEARLRSWLPSAVGMGNGFKFETFAKTELELQLLQEPHQTRTASHNTLVDLGLVVLRRNSEGGFELVGDCKRQLSPAVNTALVVEAGEHVIVPLCFNQRRALAPRRYVATCHSDTPLCVEQVPNQAAVTAEALCLVARKHGTCKQPHPGISLYTMQCQAGIMITCENATARAFSVEIDCSDSSNVISSRDHSQDLLLCCDVVPPMSKQVLMVLAPKEGVDSWSFSMKTAYMPAPDGEETHLPGFDPDDIFQEIHRPISDLSLTSNSPAANMEQVLNKFFASRGD